MALALDCTVRPAACLPTPVSPSTPFPPPLARRPSSSALRIDTALAPVHHRLPTPCTPQRTPYPHYTPRHLQARRPSSAAPSPPAATLRSPADPYADVTRLRVRPTQHPCLYPGAVFAGTQRSDRSSYDVAVTIVTADLPAAHLCGYLRIRGLTAEHPELTTYFDAQLIGPRHAFRSPPSFGASARQDAAHWARFPAYHRRDEGGAVFMRWKEKFLVPDHRVRDISGASFAGFYYVCVELDPPPRRAHPRGAPRRAASAPTPAPAQPRPPVLKPWLDADAMAVDEPAPLANEQLPACIDDLDEDDEDEEEDDAPGAARMTGFYFHPSTEPFQQLRLRHVVGSGAAGWEFR